MTATHADRTTVANAAETPSSSQQPLSDSSACREVAEHAASALAIAIRNPSPANRKRSDEAMTALRSSCPDLSARELHEKVTHRAFELVKTASLETLDHIEEDWFELDYLEQQLTSLEETLLTTEEDGKGGKKTDAFGRGPSEQAPDASELLTCLEALRSAKSSVREQLRAADRKLSSSMATQTEETLTRALKSMD